MCGRFSLTTTRDDLARELALPIDEIPRELVPRWNIAPTQPVAALRDLGGVRLDLLQWGLIPEWAKNASIGNRLINARSETLGEKPSFRDSFRDRRCLVVADGFYEWAAPDEMAAAGGRARRARAAAKTPYHFHLRTRGMFTFAGLWSRWRDPAGREVLSCTIVTGEPNALVARVHDRMPVIVPEPNRAAWLDPDHRNPASLRELLRPYDENAMAMIEVTGHVNSPAHDDPQCLEPAPPPGSKPPEGTLPLFD